LLCDLLFDILPQTAGVKYDVNGFAVLFLHVTARCLGVHGLL
jgi:hypothetical protein